MSGLLDLAQNNDEMAALIEVMNDILATTELDFLTGVTGTGLIDVDTHRERNFQWERDFAKRMQFRLKKSKTIM